MNTLTAAPVIKPNDSFTQSGNATNGAAYVEIAATATATALASAARTATNNSGDIANNSGNSVHVIINVTAATATPSVVPTIQGKDTVSGAYYNLLVGAAITGTGTTVLKVYPNAVAVANLVANDFVPKTFRVLMTHADADSITYSIGVNLAQV